MISVAKIKARLLFPYRLKVAFSYLWKPIRYAMLWSWRAKEHTNITYDLEDSNRLYLAQFVAEIESCSLDTVLSYFEEIECDTDFKKQISKAVKQHPRGWLADAQPRLGRRLAWYAWVRLRKPLVVVETGVDKGLGACVVLRALQRNEEEGVRGKYYGTDIHPQAGWMIPPHWKEQGEILYGDSLESLEKFTSQIDIFINDSDHSAVYEAKEYEVIYPKLRKKALVLGDNAHCSTSLWNFSRKKNRHFYFFAEKPKEHWYPGGGVGVSLA